MNVYSGSGSSARELTELWEITRELNMQIETRPNMISAKDVEPRIQQLLAKAQGAANRLGASEVTVTVGFPLGASVALSWELGYSGDTGRGQPGIHS